MLLFPDHCSARSGFFDVSKPGGTPSPDGKDEDLPFYATNGRYARIDDVRLDNKIGSRTTSESA